MKKKSLIIIITAAVLCAAGIGLWYAWTNTSLFQKHGNEEAESIGFEEISDSENVREIIKPEKDSPKLDENELQEVFID